VKAKVDKGKEVTGALNSVASIMKVLDDVYDTKSIFLYGTCDATEEEYKVMTGIYSKGDEIKGFVNEVGGDLKMKLTKAILPDGGSIMSTPNPARSRENARRTALRDRLHQILC
jgi:hypothetical protein